jgi:2-dehydro-3-deoxyphosphooctonate aldolase (KDO 8-P synthase)
MRIVEVSEGLRIGPGQPLVFIGGPCVIESEQFTLEMSQRIRKITDELGMKFVFKSSFDKANRSSGASFRGPGLEAGLRVLDRVRTETGVPVLTDIHEPHQAAPAAEVVDVLQIPAYLCRQTDLLVAAAKTGRVVNVKKGQFLAPYDMRHIVAKLEEAGTTKILLTERGSSFGYSNLVVDFRSLPIMRALGYPVVFDASHSVQLPGALEDRSGGDRKYVPYLARAAAAVGIDALFMEIHDSPDNALSDSASSVALGDLPRLLRDVLAVRAATPA